MENRRIFASVPRSDNLYCINCHADSRKMKNTICQTPFHAQTLVSRYIMTKFPQVIASPTDKSTGSFIVVTFKQFCENKKLQNLLRYIGTFESAKPAFRWQYEKCLKYAIEFKMSPSWNSVERFLVQGQDFLEKPFCLGAVSMMVSVNSENMIVELIPKRVKMWPINVENRKLFSVGQIVHVLPSMYQAEIISISENIPASSPLKSYEEFRTYWKAMYGYILPENCQGMQFYTVYFPYASDQEFIYPSICLCERQPNHLQKIDLTKITSDFHKCFEKSVDYICGQSVEIIADIPSSCPTVKKETTVKNEPVIFNGKSEKKNFIETPKPLADWKMSQSTLPWFFSKTPMLRKMAGRLPVTIIPKSIEKKLTYLTTHQKMKQQSLLKYFREKKNFQSNFVQHLANLQKMKTLAAVESKENIV